MTSRSRAFIMALVALLEKEKKQELASSFSPTAPTPCKDSEKTPCTNQEDGPLQHLTMLAPNLRLESPELWETVCCLNSPVFDLLLWYPEETKTSIEIHFGSNTLQGLESGRIFRKAGNNTATLQIMLAQDLNFLFWSESCFSITKRSF